MVKAQRKSDAMVAELKVRNHHFVAGLVEKLGGHDEGPNPHEYVEAALAACTVLTAQMYAARKGIPLESTDVVVKIVSEGEETQISRQISYRGDLTQEQRDRLSDILERCPIHNLLESKITISTTVS
ncbi:hypothetical protein AZI87_10745 [Bdellovibrio bacteriovorus]|uniref:Osmotically inducible protein OsmC n=1 Tax=Bdellovibrio bacteriovorus TaxID=959 RepID=A0A162G5U6_BDEBC|nr:OsmC family protein [Bdellovibrio bacteriovorus]KYG65047.1 hypothetical protein AZI87_10745 [Bdellovibrio bacteriovorus]